MRKLMLSLFLTVVAIAISFVPVAAAGIGPTP
jgi:hypothetical protein